MSSPSIQLKSAVSNPDNPIRVVIIDDSAVIRGLTKRWIGEDPALEMVASFTNGAHAVDGIAATDCDVAILDIEMPHMDGITALPKLIEKSPGTRYIIASTLSQRNADISLKALALGAADYLPKPETRSGITSTEDYRRQLVEKLKALGQARARKAPPRTSGAGAAQPARPAPPPPPRKQVVLRRANPIKPHAVVIGCSTGGPQALTEVFSNLRVDLKTPIFIAQHMPPMFTAILAEQLSKASGLSVQEGKHGDPVLPGHVYLAPGDYHMVVRRDGAKVRIELNQEPQVNYCRPAADPLFQSIAQVYGSAVLGVVLTGMGHDAREGARALVEAGGNVIAQDEESCVVWGMPGAVAEAGLACQLAPLKSVAPEVLRALGGGRS